MNLTAKILDAATPNKNGRIYPRETLEQIERQIAARLDDPGFVLGEAGIPMDLTVNLERVSHRITGARIENGSLYASIETLNTPMGNVVKELHAAGVPIDFRPRGTGFVKEDGTVTDYQLISIDAVLEGA